MDALGPVDWMPDALAPDVDAPGPVEGPAGFEAPSFGSFSFFLNTEDTFFINVCTKDTVENSIHIPLIHLYGLDIVQ